MPVLQLSWLLYLLADGALALGRRVPRPWNVLLALGLPATSAWLWPVAGSWHAPTWLARLGSQEAWGGLLLLYGVTLLLRLALCLHPLQGLGGRRKIPLLLEGVVPVLLLLPALLGLESLILYLSPTRNLQGVAWGSNALQALFLLLPGLRSPLPGGGRGARGRCFWLLAGLLLLGLIPGQGVPPPLAFEKPDLTGLASFALVAVLCVLWGVFGVLRSRRKRT